MKFINRCSFNWSTQNCRKLCVCEWSVMCGNDYLFSRLHIFQYLIHYDMYYEYVDPQYAKSRTIHEFNLIRQFVPCRPWLYDLMPLTHDKRNIARFCNVFSFSNYGLNTIIALTLDLIMAFLHMTLTHYKRNSIHFCNVFSLFNVLSYVSMYA